MKNRDTSETSESMNPFLLGFLMIVGIMSLIGLVSKEVSASYDLEGGHLSANTRVAE